MPSHRRSRSSLPSSESRWRWIAAHPFVYPAGVALVYVPFSWLPYDLAAALHVALMTCLLVGAAVLGADLLNLPRRWTVLGALAWGPAAAGVISGQNSRSRCCWSSWPRSGWRETATRHRDCVGRPRLQATAGRANAGILLLRGRWRAVGLAIITIGLQYLLGVLATGGNWAWPADWLATLGQYTTADFHDNGWQAISLPALGTRLAMVTGVGAFTVVGYAVAVVAVVASIPSLRRLPPLDAVALACAVGLLASPHAWVYDATLLLPAIAVLAVRARERGWPWQDRWIFAAGYTIGLTWALGGFVGITLVPRGRIAVPILLVRGSARPTVAVPSLPAERAVAVRLNARLALRRDRSGTLEGWPRR